MKSFVPKDGSDPPAGNGQDSSGGRNAERDFHGEKRKNARIPRPPIQMPGFSARGRARKPSSVTWDI